MKMNGKQNTAAVRVVAAILTVALMIGLVPGNLLVPAEAAGSGWAQGYLDTLVSWGVMQGYADGSLGPDNPMTRAEYVTMINRAFGYDEVGASPFEDVKPSDWFSDDISIAYNTGYFTGTSPNTAAPNNPLTREQAVVILGRNIRLQPSAGEVTAFSDGRILNEWSRGIIQSAANQGVVNGYNDGTFRPQNNITRGEMAALLVPVIGTPLQEAGDYTLGGVYGNVTISTSGVTLRNTTIAGDLYLTGGIGLGSTTLENVTVLGKIIISGAGESDKGQNSIILRNVEANDMVVDGLKDWFVTLRAEGDTNIANTSVRTSAYLEDATSNGMGLKYIELNGENGITLELAGNIGEVMNLTPNSKLTMAQGTANVITIDEKATNSTLTISQNAAVKNLNLDVGTRVYGPGDIDNLTVNANGSTVDVLPDNITVRPGVSGNIDGENMDTVTAAEASEDPRILAGYPVATDVAPTSATATFSANKRGTIYWAVSAVTDGSVKEDDLITPPTYGSNIVVSGQVKVTESKKEYTAKLTKLTSDGSYYLSAVLVDSREEHSPVKVASFSTPDNTVPNFSAGYPVMSKITHNSGQVTVMPTKSCQLYYALLPKGGTAPTANDFKANAVTGNLGYGTMDVTKNVTKAFTVNRSTLDELVSYDLYLWLTDYDGAKSSAVKKISFTTIDGTPPVFNTAPYVTAVKTTSIGFTFNLNEAGTVYWVAVKAGAEYPKPMAGQTGEVPLNSPEAKLQVASGMNGLKSGKVNATANKDGTFTVSGLEEQTSYDVYYIAMDKAGNYADSVGKITANTLDNKAPMVTQEFTRYNGNDKETPLADTDIRLVFNEGVQEADVKENKDGKSLLALYQDVENATKDKADSSDDAPSYEQAKENLAGALRRTVLLYDATSNGPASLVKERTKGSTNTDWVVDYRNAEVTLEDTKVVVTFRTTSDTANDPSALNLKSGSTYYFKIQGLADTSSTKNLMGVTQLQNFTTVFAQVNLMNTSISSANIPGQTKPVNLHMSFEVAPVATDKVADSIYWDMLLWSDTSVSFDLYRRPKTASGSEGEWALVGDNNSITSTNEFDGLSLTRDIICRGEQATFQPLNKMNQIQIGDNNFDRYEYGVHFTKVGGLSDEATWSRTVQMKFSIGAGSVNNLGNMASSVTPNAWKEAKENGEVTSIGLPDDFTIKKVFSDQKAPDFVDNKPTFYPTDSAVTMKVTLDRPGTVYYVVAPEGDITTKKDNAPVSWTQVPKSGDWPEGDTGDHSDGRSYTLELSDPAYNSIVAGDYKNSRVKKGWVEVGGGSQEIVVNELEANTKYMVYFVLKGAGQVFSENVLCYGFETEKVSRPIITMGNNNPSVTVSTDRDAKLEYMLVVSGEKLGILDENFAGSHLDPQKKSDFEEKNKGGEDEEETKGWQITKVIEALCTDVLDSNGNRLGSVFDLYASEAAKNSVAATIRSAKENNSSITWVSPMPVSMKADQMQSFDCTSHMFGSLYCFLAVAKSPLGSGDAFRAIRPLSLVDNEKPKITNTTVSVTSDTKITAPDQSFGGVISIDFNKDLYWVTKSGSEVNVKPIYPIDKDKASSKYMPQNLVYDSRTIPIISVNEGSPGVCSSLAFSVWGAKANQTINLKAGIGSKNGAVHESQVVLTIKMEKVGEGTDAYYQPYITIGNKDWDANVGN